MCYTIVSLVALATVAATAPSDSPWKDSGALDPWGEFGIIQKRQDNPWKNAGVIDPWGEYGNQQAKHDLGPLTKRQIPNDVSVVSRDSLHGDTLTDFVKRTSIGEFNNYLPGCNDDSSSKNTPKPDLQVNQGVKIPKEGHDDPCTTGHGADHCWTEYRIVEAAIEYMSWQPAGNAIRCDGTATCSTAETNMKQSCSTTCDITLRVFDVKIIDAALKLSPSFGGKQREADLSTGITFGYDHTTQNLKQVCQSLQSPKICTWEHSTAPGADNCHQAWYADRVLHVWGQAQRTCHKCSNSGNFQQNTGDGKVCVRGQKEFDLVLPINKLVYCNGKCNQADPGVGIPDNSTKAPYQAPSDWDSLHLRTELNPQ
ncbi:MAG: hypothetical protein M1820_010937 [Bogoriella megaspora]|nr:MAG: hypothetical protein M1820_010937 [Bogoriella megaspora]